MGRGEAARKRVNRALKAQAEKQVSSCAVVLQAKGFLRPWNVEMCTLDPLMQKKDPATLLAAKKKGVKPSDVQRDGVPSSLRRMLQLKAAAEGKAAPEKRKSAFGNGSMQKKRHASETTDGSKPQNSPAAPGVQGSSSAVVAQNKPPMPQETKIVPAKGLTEQKPSLKARKKEFLKKKKLRRKGKLAGQGSDEEGSDPEERLRETAAATKPAFAEQAEQPIQMNLKRRHWTDEDQKRAGKRCSKIFERQMNQARRQAGVVDGRGGSRVVSEELRDELVEAYRQHKRVGGGAKPKATLRSLTELVHRDNAAREAV